MVVPCAREVYGSPAKVKLPGYARFVTSRSGIPRFEEGDEDGADMSKAEFADSAVATVSLYDFRQWLSDREWQEVVEPFVSEKLWQEKVLADDWVARAADSRSTCSPPRLTVEQQKSLFVKGYVRRTRHAKFLCNVFAVWKSDGKTLRLIWNGRMFNKGCRPPPPFTITRLPEMLAKLLKREVRTYVTYDATTWFLQFQIVPEIAKYFCTRLWDGREVELSGVPMGAAWACALAQTLTIALGRAVVEELSRKGIHPVAFEVCIDNSIFGLRSVEESSVVMETVKAVAKKLNVVLKESAFEVGPQVEWLAYRLDAEKHTADFKDGFKQRAAKVLDRVVDWKEGSACVLDVWTAAGFVMFSLYASRRPLSRVKGIIDWMVANTPKEVKGWRSEAVAVPWIQLEQNLKEVGSSIVNPPPVPDQRVVAWFVTDAATSGSNAAVVVVGNVIFLSVKETQRERIEARELQAHLHACVRVLETGVNNGYVVGYGDNVVALSAQRRGYSLWAEPSLEAAVGQVRGVMEGRELVLGAPYVSTHACVADVWTRVRGLQMERKAVCQVGHEHVPGVFCDVMTAQLRVWAAEAGGHDIDGKLSMWGEHRGDCVPFPPRDLVREGALKGKE